MDSWFASLSDHLDHIVWSLQKFKGGVIQVLFSALTASYPVISVHLKTQADFLSQKDKCSILDGYCTKLKKIIMNGPLDNGQSSKVRGFKISLINLRQ